MILGNPVDGPRIVPFGEPRLATDKLPNGRAGFRVTQTFDNPDYYWSTQGVARKHAALDLGNFVCGDRVKACAAGKALTGIDSAGALYVVVDHGNGWLSRYWHLDGWSIPRGVWVQVAAGQQIGIVGDTGLGAICHLHFEAVYQGIRQDPWKLLAQNLGPQVAVVRDPMFEVIPQRWTVAAGGAIVYDGVNGAPTGQRLSAGLPVKSLGEPLANRDWRVLLVSPTPGSRHGGYVKRRELDDIPRDAAFEDAVWAILTTWQMPAGGFTADQVSEARKEAAALVVKAASDQAALV